MKKIALYVSIASALVVSNGMGMEIEQEKYELLTSQLSKVDAELIGEKQLLDDILSQIGANSGGAAFSSYQKQLLCERTQGKIGNEAWIELGTENQQRADKLWNIIQLYRGKTVNIVYLNPSKSRFKIVVNEKLEDAIHTF